MKLNKPKRTIVSSAVRQDSSRNQAVYKIQISGAIPTKRIEVAFTPPTAQTTMAKPAAHRHWRVRRLRMVKPSIHPKPAQGSSRAVEREM